MPANPEVRQFIREYAQSIGIDPDVAERVSASEALNVFDPNRPDHGGDLGSSFGPFQLHYGGVVKSMPNGGLGDEFTKATGLDARDPSTWKEQVKYALNTAKKDGWRQWMGAAKSGIPRWAGIREGGVTENAIGPTARYDPRSDTPSSARPTGEQVADYATEHPTGAGGDLVTNTPSPYDLPKPGTAENPLVTTEAKNPYAKIGAAVAKLGDRSSAPSLGPVTTPQNPALSALPAMSSVDPTTSNNQRAQLIQAMMRLNSGQLFPSGGGIG